MREYCSRQHLTHQQLITRKVVREEGCLLCFLCRFVRRSFCVRSILATKKRNQSTHGGCYCCASRSPEILFSILKLVCDFQKIFILIFLLPIFFLMDRKVKSPNRRKNESMAALVEAVARCFGFVKSKAPLVRS